MRTLWGIWFARAFLFGRLETMFFWIEGQKVHWPPQSSLVPIRAADLLVEACRKESAATSHTNLI